MRLLIVLSFLLVSLAMADEPVLPTFQSPPWKYEHKHQIARLAGPSPDVVTDELLIGDVTDKDLMFYFYLIGTNGHICGGSGTAFFQNGAYYYTRPSIKRVYKHGKLKKESAECRLRIRFDSDQALLQDEGGNCKEALCGMRAYIGDVRFTRAR